MSLFFGNIGKYFSFVDSLLANLWVVYVCMTTLLLFFKLIISISFLMQSNLPPDLKEYQRLRCRVAFHALQFRQEVQELATNILRRSKSYSYVLV